jgi:dCTP diphosphatase
MAKLDLEKIIAHQRQFVRERDWEQFHTPKNLAMALSGEVGELTECFQWLTEAQASAVMKDEKKAAAVRHEVADVFFYLVRLCDVLGVDIDAAFWEKMRLNAAKYPADKAKGSHAKYTDYE